MNNFSVFSSIYQLTQNADAVAKNMQAMLSQGNMDSGQLTTASLEVGRQDNKVSMFLDIMQKVWSGEDKVYGMTG